MSTIADEVGVSARTMRRAVIDGTLRGVRLGPRRLRLPISERDYVRRAWPEIAAMREVLRTQPNVRFALLFGSLAAGTHDDTSDIDLLVDLTEADLDRMVDLSAKLTEALDRRVDLVRLQDAESEPGLLSDALSDGRVVVDRDQRWEGLRRRQGELGRRATELDDVRVRHALAGIDGLLAT